MDSSEKAAYFPRFFALNPFLHFLWKQITKPSESLRQPWASLHCSQHGGFLFSQQTFAERTLLVISVQHFSGSLFLPQEPASVCVCVCVISLAEELHVLAQKTSFDVSSTSSKALSTAGLCLELCVSPQVPQAVSLPAGQKQMKQQAQRVITPSRDPQVEAARGCWLFHGSYL